MKRLNPLLDRINVPTEWEIDDATLARIGLTREQLLRIRPVDGVYHARDLKRLERLARHRWFLLANSGPVDDIARCRRCGQKHRYLTLGCRERPFDGLQDLIGMAQVADHQTGERNLWSIEIGTITPISEEVAYRAIGAIVSVYGVGIVGNQWGPEVLREFLARGGG